MACNCFNEFDEINMVISFIRDSADHNNRYIALVTNLSHRCAFHFYTQCVWQICFESVSQRGVRDKLVTSHDQPSLNLWLRYSKLVEDIRLYPLCLYLGSQVDAQIPLGRSYCEADIFWLGREMINLKLRNFLPRIQWTRI